MSNRFSLGSKQDEWPAFHNTGANTVNEVKRPLLLVRTPRGAPGLPEGVPADYDDFWLYRTRPGTDRMTIDTLFYADDAVAACEIFVRLRDEGVIPAAARQART